MGDPRRMHFGKRLNLAAALVLIAAAGCATISRPRPALSAQVATDARALDAAVEAFYSAKDPAALRAAAQAARAAAPSAGKTHELEAELARLEMRDGDEFEALFAAAQDTNYDATRYALHRIEELARTDEQHGRYVGLLEELAQAHPDPRVRGAAGFVLTAHLHVAGDDAARDEAAKQLSGMLPLAVVGGWDNDQGKGFDIAYPPEKGVDLSAKYEGSLMQIGWEKNPPRDVRGETELRDFIAPDRWSAAYLASGFRTSTPGTYELRVSSSDPVKIFVDGTPIFEARELEGAFVFDQFVVPVKLEAGDHQLLIKSAHRLGDWRVLARITGERGAPADIKATEAGPTGRALAPAELVTSDEATDAAVAHFGEGTARQARFRTFHSAYTAGGNVTVRAAQAFSRAFPSSIVSRYELIAALWNNNERGRTADELVELERVGGDALPLIRKQQARFWQQEGLKARARKSLLELVKAYPERTAAARQLAELFAAEKWIEDSCRTLEAVDTRRPRTLDVKLEVAECWLSERREDLAVSAYRELLGGRPRHYGVLRRLHDALRDRGQLDDAADVARKLVAAYPEKLFPRLTLAETLRRAGRYQRAQEALVKAQAAFPNSADVRRAQAALAWRMGDEQKAVEAWQAALLRSPEDDATANRLDFVAPEQKGAWAEDIPNDERIGQALGSRQMLAQKAGADLAYLLDHEVTALRSDGSTINVVTNVVHAFNQQGRDKLTRRRLAYGGRVRVLQAFSIDANGRRSEASVRQREVLYRGLDVGSTIVLQYRADSPPSGFLPRYLSKSWSFQSVNDQRSLSEFVLWYPSGNTLNEVKVGDLVREEKRVGEEVRVSWALQNVGPVVPEPHMPNLIEVAANLNISTIPAWDTYNHWEEALLEGAFRDSPELDALAQKLAAEAKTPHEKLLKIHQFVMEEIRYQQDYESFIAGVKPHPASMVVERRYGDCKDKTVLFMTLAKKLGLTAQFATVRTRDRGQIMKGLPTQQFNHAIVYVPKQEGLAEGRFFDATADALDLEVLRDDNAGTESLVYDPNGRTHQWVQIPWQTPDHHRIQSVMALKLASDGTAQGELELHAKGKAGSSFRRVSRNPEQFKQFMQVVAGSYFTGASSEGAAPIEVKDLTKPAVLKTTFLAPNAARREGEALRLRLPTWSARDTFNLATRRHALVLGTPSQQQWRYRITLPEGMQAARMPTSGEVNTDCIKLRRTVTPTADGLSVEQDLEIRCERISATEYPAYRTQMEQMNRFLDEELVVTPATVPVVKPVKATKRR